MKMLWHTNAPWAPTGYGSQASLFAPRLAEHYELAISSYYGLDGARLNWEGIPIFPGFGGGDYGNASLLGHAKRYFGENRGGLVLTLLDVWVLDAQMCAQMNMASWVPVDHDPIPPAVTSFFRTSGAIPIAMSRFGEERLEEFDPLYVPHGVDLDAFKPHEGARELVGAPEDAFIVGIVAANKGRPSRKSFQQSLEAFAVFRERHENAILYLHTIVDQHHSQGEDVVSMIKSLGIEDDVRIADQYRMAFDPMTPGLMAQVYSTFDVLLNPSRGEGFGIPVLEAAACGVPAVVTDFSAMSEVCKVGWKVGHRPQWNTGTGGTSWQAIPDVEAIVGALEECYERSDAERASMATEARRHAGKYGVERVMEKHFLPALEKVQERFEALEPVPVAA